MQNFNHNKLISNWLKTWSMSRNLPLPIRYKSGLLVNVGYDNQKFRYVFPEFNEDLIQLSIEINEPNIFLKYCELPDEIENKISPNWKVQPLAYMMRCLNSMNNISTELTKYFHITCESYNSTHHLKIISAKDNMIASESRIVIINGLAVYDRIITNENYKRRGLASIIMKELEKIAIANQVSNGFLVATEQGKHLYESLGWEVYSPYTTLVIT